MGVLADADRVLLTANREMHRRICLVLALATLTTTVVSPPVGAGETDQYIAWGTSLDDATEEINSYVNEGIETTLARLRHPERFECGELPPRIYRYLFHGLLRSRLRHYLQETPDVDRYPGADVGYFGYLRGSVFRRPAFPFFMPMARTIQIDGVHLGIDKVNHIFGFGRRYYNRYHRARRRGLSEEEAMAMIEELNGAQILMGARGQKRFDIDAIADAVVHLSQLLMDFPQIKELDINPLRIFHEGDGCLALDARIILD